MKGSSSHGEINVLKGDISENCVEPYILLGFANNCPLEVCGIAVEIDKNGVF